jgi:uncharacterized protein (DUF983 family)
MENSDNQKKPSILNLLICKCPRCRRGDMFQHSNPYKLNKFMKMNETCPVCGQVFDIEVGFYYGTGFVSYALAVALSVATLVAWWVLIGVSIDDNRIFYWLGFNALFLVALQPILMRLSRTIWLAFFVPYDRQWRTKEAKKPERVNADQMNGW